MRPTIKDIAQKVGKSVSTVSKALNDFEDISVETKERVRQVAIEMGYVPSVVAQRLKKRRSDTLGIILPDYGTGISDPYFCELLAGISKSSSKLGFDLIVSIVSPGENELDAYRQKVRGDRVDGLIIVHTRRNDERIELIRSLDFPFVVFGRAENNKNYSFVDVDNAYGIGLLVDYLLQLGHKRFAVITPPINLMSAKYQLNGVQMKLREVGIKLEDGNILEGDLTQRSGYIQSLILFGLPIPPTAIIACNDLMAIGAINAANSKGIKVGSEVSITGFDNIPMAEYSFPPLTTLHQPIYKIGELLSELIINHILSDEAIYKEIILQPSLIIRQSCGEPIRKI